jgi:tetratricopeptide (TPR) repeat protein
LYCTNDVPERTPTMLRLTVQDIDIAPGEKNYTVTDSFVLPLDVDVLAVQPHAHYLAHDLRGFATLPDGTTKQLIYIKDWDLRWQHVYRYATPFALPKGTTVSMRYTYDNSTDNPRNPQQPPARVAWGQQSREEMGDLWIQMLTRDEGDRRTLNAAVERKMATADVVGYEQLIRRDPARASLRDDIAVLYLALNRPADAVPHFEASVRLKPESAPAHFNLATTLTSVGRFGEAVGQYLQALQLRPDYAIAHNNLGSTLLQLRRQDEAIQQFREAVRIDPSLAEAHFNLGSLARAGGAFSEAIAEFRQAVRLDPGRVSGCAGVASLLATVPDAALRDPGEAIRLAQQATDMTGRRDANALDVLAAAYAASGDFERAIAVAQEALALNPPAQIAAAIRMRQELYKQHQPYISGPPAK